MNPVVKSIGIAIGLGFVAVSFLINLRYGAKVGGSSDYDKVIQFAISVLVDGWKAFGLVVISAAMTRFMVLRAAAGMVLWALCVAYSLASAFGYANDKRAEIAGKVTTQSSTYRDMLGERDRKKRQLDSLGVYEPASVIEQRLTTERLKSAWSESKLCVEATPRTRQFCTEYRQRETERAKAMTGEALEGEIKTLNAKLPTFGNVVRQDKSGDTLAGALSSLFGFSVEKVQVWLSLLLVAVVEFGSMFVLFAVLQPPKEERAAKVSAKQQPAKIEPQLNSLVPIAASRSSELLPAPFIPDAKPIVAPAPLATPLPELTPPPRAEPPASMPRPVVVTMETGRIEQFMLECVGDRAGARVDLGLIEKAYQAWCRNKGVQAVPSRRFVPSFGKLCAMLKYRTEGRRGKFFVLGVELVETASADHVLPYLVAHAQPGAPPVDAGVLHDHYNTWCAKNGITALDRVGFLAEFDAIRGAHGDRLPISRLGERCYGVAIAA